jgi:hypothetical protein
MPSSVKASRPRMLPREQVLLFASVFDFSSSSYLLLSVVPLRRGIGSDAASGIRSWDRRRVTQARPSCDMCHDERTIILTTKN